MNWDGILNMLPAIGAFLGGGWLLGFYNAKPKKKAIELENRKMEIENMKRVVDELQDVITQMREHNAIYRKETEEKIQELNKKIKELSEKLDKKHEAIFSACRCKLVSNLNDCIVWKAYKDSLEDNKSKEDEEC